MVPEILPVLELQRCFTFAPQTLLCIFQELLELLIREISFCHIGGVEVCRLELKLKFFLNVGVQPRKLGPAGSCCATRDLTASMEASYIMPREDCDLNQLHIKK